MANRYPLVVDTTDGNKVKEIPNGDSLQLTGNSIIGVVNVTASGALAANELNAVSIKKGGTEIATVALTGAYSDLSNRPTALSDLTDDLNVLVPGDNVGQLANNVGYLTAVAFADLTTTPTTLAGYGITDAATSAQGALASTSTQPGANISTLLNNAGYLTAADLADNVVNINYTGDVTGSVFADDSTLLIDGVLASFNLDQTIRTNVVPAANGLYDLGTTGNKFKDAYIQGTVTATAFVGDGSGLTGISGGGGGGLPSRSTATSTTGSLAATAQADLDITGFKSYTLLTITTDKAARVRLYVNAATRTADAARAEGVDPTSDAGLIAEVITTGAETVIISPGAYGFNLESTPTTNIPCRVTNKSGSTGTVQVDVNILQLEV